MEYNELLNIYRYQIDTLDKELINLFSRRFEIVEQIGIIKRENNIEALQTDRWEQLMKDNIEMAKELMVSESFIRDVWNRVHEESLNIEKK
ncbi:MAG: chorismate mutase [Candidatus Gracilibacteria bacterium]|nr:chorismate mutase [Candidatus Gracilibacteria bacterium]